ncbi:MAG: hypothetical protein ACTSPA_13315 [Promethearchaeota archaeon]
MANIGLMGALNVGKTAILKMFVDYVENGKICSIMECYIEKKEFKGESEYEVKDGDNFSKTILPNKVVFTYKKTGGSHTLFAPGGARDHAVIRMGIITISRIAREIVGLFAVDQSLNNQFKLYDLIRYMPKRINIILTNLNKIPEYGRDKNLEDIKYKIENYFNNRRIKVNQIQSVYLNTDNPGLLDKNYEAMRMILKISSQRNIV